MLLQGTSSFYGAQVEALQNNPQNNLNTDANTAVLQEAIFNRDLLSTAAVGFWITSGIVAGAAGALWLFDPRQDKCGLQLMNKKYDFHRVI